MAGMNFVGFSAAEDYPCSMFTDCWQGGHCPGYTIPLCLKKRCVCIMRSGDIIPLIVNATYTLKP